MTTNNPGDVIRHLADQIDADVYLYNGTVHRARDLEYMETVKAHIGHTKALMILVTNGGDPDSAYKLARYFQDKYETFSLLISGVCKSAGTLMAIGAHELIFTPFGELGPLDIQLTKVDRFDKMQSGLTIQDALTTLEDSATRSFYNMVTTYIQTNNGLISFATASKAASDFVTQLYAPILQRIDPEEVGARARSMRIAVDYGERLAARSSNLKQLKTLNVLAETYPSHSFVIDQQEASTLFNRVRSASEQEKALVVALGQVSRHPGTTAIFQPLSTRRVKIEEASKGSAPHETNGSRNSTANGGDYSEAISAPDAAAGQPSEGSGMGEEQASMGNGAA